MDTLVLDAGYRPLDIVDWKRAFVLLAENKVEVVEEYSDRFVSTVSVRFNVPCVIRFLRRMRTTKRAVKFSRSNIFARDAGRCQYCGNQVRRNEGTYDHVLPRAQGGHTRWENIVLCCYRCNQRKANRTPHQAGMLLKVKPVKPKSLPDGESIALSYRRGYPPQWRQWLTDLTYWETELDQE